MLRKHTCILCNQRSVANKLVRNLKQTLSFISLYEISVLNPKLCNTDETEHQLLALYIVQTLNPVLSYTTLYSGQVERFSSSCCIDAEFPKIKSRL